MVVPHHGAEAFRQIALALRRIESAMKGKAMRRREQPKIDIFVRQYNPIYRRVVSEYWGTVYGFICERAAQWVERDVVGPAGIVARTGEKVFACFRKPKKKDLNYRRLGDT